MTNIQHGMARTPTHIVWKGMRARCSNPNALAFDRYGGRGITVCERWNRFENFYADMGEKPKNKSLDRIDNNKGYSPENCRWASRKEQSCNRRSNIRIEFLGQNKLIIEWAEHFKIGAAMIYARFHRGLKGEALFVKKYDKTIRLPNSGKGLPRSKKNRAPRR